MAFDTVAIKTADDIKTVEVALAAGVAFDVLKVALEAGVGTVINGDIQSVHEVNALLAVRGKELVRADSGVYVVRKAGPAPADIAARRIV
jgi:hypothetical protein